MNTVFFDTKISDDSRRQQLFAGQLFVYTASPSSLALCQLARELSEAAFAPLDPRQAQHSLPVEQYAAILAELKPKFIHHPECKRLIPGILAELECDLDKTYFDVPRLRTATCGDYLSSGIAYAFHPHRDTWYSAPMCQLNWWIPVYAVESENVMAFHPRYWAQPVKNGSKDYNYREWNRVNRKAAAQHIKTDTRKQPRPEEELELDPQIRIVCPPGGIILFSGAQMHSTVPNTSRQTRVSIDFRTVHIDDVISQQGAPNVDSQCTGTTMGDYLRASDLSNLPDPLIAQFDTPSCVN